MKTIIACLLFTLFVLSGCGVKESAQKGERATVKGLESDKTQECVVKLDWLNLDYDHEIDHQYQVRTDFYLLVYSHSPSFCQKKRRSGDISEVAFQCDSPNEFGWVIHGLWAESREAYLQGESSKHPRFCQGNLEKVDLNILIPYLCMSPGTRLLQGEWEKHGSCIYDTPQQYFSKTKELYERFGSPPADLKARDAMHWMKDNSEGLDDNWLYLQGSEFGICLNLDFDPISCPRNE